MKSSFLFVATILLLGMETYGQDSTVVLKQRKFRYGLFFSAEREYLHSSYSPYKPSINQGNSFGLSFRYRLSKSFSLYGGIAASLYKERYIFQRYSPGFSGGITEMITYQNRRFSYQIPVYLQINAYKEKIFASLGFEIFEVLHTNIITERADFTQGTKTRTKESTDYGVLESNLLLGIGWNFKALNNNDFTVEFLTKTYFLSNTLSNSNLNYILTPSLKLNWFIKRNN